MSFPTNVFPIVVPDETNLKFIEAEKSRFAGNFIGRGRCKQNTRTKRKRKNHDGKWEVLKISRPRRKFRW